MSLLSPFSRGDDLFGNAYFNEHWNDERVSSHHRSAVSFGDVWWVVDFIHHDGVRDLAEYL